MLLIEATITLFFKHRIQTMDDLIWYWIGMDAIPFPAA
jgi:hypothetical protein